jgi:DNA-binding response OmpR family regulator
VHLLHQMVMLDGQTITLTRNQYSLLVLLLEHAGEVVPRAIVSRKVFGSASTRMVKGHIAHCGETRDIRRPIPRNGP